MLQESENCVDENTSVPDILFEKFQLAHPHVNVGRPKRLYDTVKRIAAPTQPSLRGGSKISGQDLLLYRSKTWVPRVRNPGPEGILHFLFIAFHMNYVCVQVLCFRRIYKPMASMKSCWLKFSVRY